MLLPFNKTSLKSKDLVIFSSTMYNEYFAQDTLNRKKQFSPHQSKPKNNYPTQENSNLKYKKYTGRGGKNRGYNRYINGLERSRSRANTHFVYKGFNFKRKPKYRKNKRRISYRRDSSHFLKYLVKKMKINKVFEGEHMLYKTYFTKYLRYFYKFSAFKKKDNLSFYRRGFKARVSLIYKANGLVGCRPYGRGLKNFYRLRFLESRFRSDGKKHYAKLLYDMSKFEKYKNLFFFRKAKDEDDKLSIIWKQYRYLRQWRPYSFVQKRHKLFFNLGDCHVVKRFPIYRYKFPLLYFFPRYANYRRLYKNQLREQHLFRWLYRLKLSQLISYFRKSTNNKKYSFELMFLKHFEWRLDAIVYRLNFAFSLKHARQLVNRGFFTVNNKIINHYTFHVGVGDLIMPIKRLRIMKHGKRYLHKKDRGLTFMNLRLFYRPIQMDQYPDFFLINERIPAALIIKNLNPLQLRYTRPFSIQYLTLSLLKYT
jgi:hypothetical protein